MGERDVVQVFVDAGGWYARYLSGPSYERLVRSQGHAVIPLLAYGPEVRARTVIAELQQRNPTARVYEADDDGRRWAQAILRSKAQ